jgi:Kef-type K+ transport system membrane component KefB
MKRLIVVAGLLALMLGLNALGTGSAALTLAAIGFVILAAFAIAELLDRFGVPKVTGYILSGVVLGPHVADVLSLDVVDEMRMFNTLAVGLIALLAGLSLDLAALRNLGRTITATTLAKLAIVVPLVAATLIGVELALHPLDSPDPDTTVALGLVFGALAIGTSPAIALAITSETEARGRLADLVLGSAVIKDVVVVVMLALAIAFGHSVIAEGRIGTEVLGQVGAELGLSILVGAAVGGLLIAYLRFIVAEMLLFVAALVLVVAELAEVLHVDLLLVCIVAGFVVRNFSERERELLPPLQLVSLPVFVVFFTIAGASVDLGTMIGALPLALALCLVRAGGYWISARIGNRFGGEPEPVAANAWFAYLPQAGATLGTIAIATAVLPDQAEGIASLGMAVVSINLLLGPPILRFALRRAGEIPGEVASQESIEAIAAEAADGPAVVLADARLELRVRQLHERLGVQVEQTIAAFVGPWSNLRRQRFASLGNEASPAAIDELAEAHPPADALALSRTLAKLFEQTAAELERLDNVTDVPMEPRWWTAQPREPTVQAFRRVLRHTAARLGRRRAGRRRIPLRLTARTAYEPRLATAMLELFRAACRCDARVADLLRRRLGDSLGADELGPAITAVLDDFATAAREIPGAALASSDRAMRAIADRIDSPVMSIGALDFSDVAGTIERELLALQQEAEAWPTVVDACWQSVAMAARVHVLHGQLAGGRATVVELGRAGEALDEELGAFERRLGELREAVDREAEQTDREALLSNLSMRCRGLLPKPASKRLRQLDTKLRRQAELRAVRQGVRELFARETGPRPLASTELAATVAIPARLRIREIDVRELIDGEISGRLLPRTQQRIEAAAVLVDECVQAASTIVGDVELLLEVYRARESGETELDTLRTSLERISTRAAELHERTKTELDTIGQTIVDDFDALAKRLAGSLDEATEASEAAHWVSRRADRARLEFGRSLAGLRDRALSTWAELKARIANATANLNADYRVRSGQALLSANDIAAMLPGPPNHLPREYAALFTEQPIRDPRFFVANREALRNAGKAERSWIDGSTGNGVLVIGGPGTGKTSLLAVAQLRLATREVVWLPAHQRGLLEALAGELRCPAREEPILRRLQDRKRVVVIDDLQRLLPPGPAAATELERLLGLIAGTEASCFWLVAIERELQRLIEPLLPLRAAFGAVIELESRDIDELETAVIARHRISGKPLSFPPAPRLRGLLTRIPGVHMRSQERQFFTRLAESSKGNLRAALAEWCRRAQVQDEALVLAPSGRSRGLPFVRQLPPPALTVLATLLRFGPCRGEELGEAMAIPSDELARWLHFLITANLVSRDEQDGYQCPARVRDQLAPELAELHVFHGGVG